MSTDSRYLRIGCRLTSHARAMLRKSCRQHSRCARTAIFTAANDVCARPHRHALSGPLGGTEHPAAVDRIKSKGASVHCKSLHRSVQLDASHPANRRLWDRSTPRADASYPWGFDNLIAVSGFQISSLRRTKRNLRCLMRFRAPLPTAHRRLLSYRRSI